MSLTMHEYNPAWCDGHECPKDCEGCEYGEPLRPSYDDWIELQIDFRDCRNELCLKCEAYQYNYKTHECDGCRWKH